jgi:predicted N-acetyltransferase YhbS
MRAAIEHAKALGHSAVILVGDEPYYRRFGFSKTLTENLRMPGPYEPHRLLACELRPGALAGAHGLIRATGARLPMTLHTSRAAEDKPARTPRAA